MDPSLEQLLDNVARKRRALRDKAHIKQRRRRQLSIISGLLAFASGVSVLSVLSAFLPNSDAVKLIAALLAFTSTLVTLISQTYFDDKEIVKMFEGAAEFLALRGKLEEVISAITASNEKSLKNEINKLRRKYEETSSKYDNVLPDDHSETVEIFVPPRL